MLPIYYTKCIFQVIFKKILSKRQWLSLLLLTFGCMLKQVNFSDETPLVSSKSTSIHLGINGFYIVIQIVCSCLAGVYNEYLLKNKGADVNIFVQNVFMYLDSIVCNLFLLLFNGNIAGAFEYRGLLKIFHYKVLLVMVNNAAIGIVTSFFLKTLNSILKTFASALELVLTAILSYMFFSIPIYLNTVLAIGTVMYAVYLYSQNPVQNLPKSQKYVAEEEELLEMEEV